MSLNAKNDTDFNKVLAVLPALNNFALIHEQKVAWGDMDAFEHVNNVQYHRYIESTRLAYYAQVQLLMSAVTVVFKNSCTYLNSISFPDTLYIGAHVDELRTSSIKMSFDVYSLAQMSLVAQAESVVVLLNKEMTEKIPIPESLRQKLIDFEATVGHQILL